MERHSRSRRRKRDGRTRPRRDLQCGARSDAREPADLALTGA
jgi:hypothetical protein